LSVVKENIAALEGAVTFESVPGVGAALRMVVPTTRATIHGVVLEVAGRPFVLPIAGLQGVIRIAKDEVLSTVRVPTVLFNGQVIPLVELTEVLAVAPSRRDSGGKHLQAFVLSSGAHTIAFVVDAILIEQSILVKPLGPLLGSIRMISGATMLPNGRVAPVLEARGVLATARRLTTGPARDSVPASAGSQTDDEDGDRSRSVLIAEDSMTSRMMLRNILMTAGYEVRTAVDGADALASLSAEEFDAVVSDVEMPNMNGFDLTAAIRADKALSHLPVILVTSLESPQDKARGMEVGASAYLVKNRFDQFRLLDTLRNLIEQASGG